MSDCAPPNYKRDLKICKAWRDQVYADLKLADTRRNAIIFEHACEITSYCATNISIPFLRNVVKEKVEDPRSWEHITD